MGIAVHITGAAGSGVTTLGHALAHETHAIQLDTDDFYWLPLEPRYMNVRPLTERLNLIKEAMKLAGQNGWILSGSIDDWGTSLEENFSLIVFLYTPTEVRISRLIAREIEKFGAEAIAPGGPRYENYQWFIEWASNYDSGTTEGRDLQLHETFLARQRCPVLRLSGTTPISRLVDDVVDVLQNRTT